jgi:FKBP-type peptidyl-prolyl cis-trans isomerase
MKKPATQFSRLLNYVVFAFIGYAVYITYINPPKPEPKGNAPQNSLLYETRQTDHNSRESKDLLGMFSVLSNPMQPRLNVINEVQGKGSEVVCGQNLTYRYSDTIIGESEPFQKNKESTLRFGKDPIILGHLQTLLTLKVGGSKTVQYPHLWGYVNTGPENARGKDLQSEIHLVSATPEMPLTAMPMRLFADPPQPSGKRFLCGSQVQANLEIRSVEGTLIYPKEGEAKKAIAIRIGAGEVPYGIESALQLLSAGDKASILIPPAFQKRFNPLKPGSETAKLFDSIALPEKQMVLVDVSELSELEPSIIEKPATAAAISEPQKQ